jgi:hypothetical protein
MDRVGLVGPRPAPDLLNTDCTDEGKRLGFAELAETVGGGPLAQHVDQDRGVEKEDRSAHPARVPSPLRANPGRRVLIPLVPLILDGSDRGEDLVPATLVVEGAPEKPSDERAPPSLANSLVQLGHELILETYV